jgi:hypothetical protein
MRKSMFIKNDIDVGVTKSSFVKTYGPPFSSSIEENGVEVLEYKEVVDVKEYTYILSSKFYFKNSKLFKTVQEEKDPPCSERIRLVKNN